MKRGLEIGPGGGGGLPDDARIRWDKMGVVGKLDIICRWGAQKIKAPNATYDEIFASHVIEHVDWRLVRPALTEAHRVLKPGGTIEIWTLNMKLLVDAYMRGECGDGWRRSNPKGDPFVWLVARIFAYGPPDGDENNWHKGAFDPPYMRRLLVGAGFEAVKVIRTRTRGGAHGKCEFGMRATRPARP